MAKRQFLSQSAPPTKIHPHWGERVTFENFHIELVPAAPRQFNVKLDQAFASISFGGDEGKSNLASGQDRNFERRPFEFLIAPPNMPLKGVSEMAPEVLVFVFDFPAMRDCLAAANQMDPADLHLQIFFGAPRPITTELAKRIRKHILGGRLSHRFLEAISLVLLAEMLAPLKETRVDQKPTVNPAIINKIADYITANLHEELSLEILSSFAGCSPTQFTRAFKKTIGTSPRQFILDQRITAARTMIDQSDLPLSDIAYATGFSSQSHMTSTFTRILGTSPGAMRSV